ncbi:MAG: RNA pseudouridine synthase [Rickettsiales bacterium]|nr:RNA pseudouridine synthase [Rickettsiales bacterium]
MAPLYPPPMRHRVRSAGEGRQLLDYLSELIPLPREEVLKAIDEGRFRLEIGPPLSSKARLRAGQILLADVPERGQADPFLPPPPERLIELFNDQHLLAVNKPAGLLCHPLGLTRTSALTIAGRQLAGAAAGELLRCVHRLDRETSGALLLARNLAADQAMGRLFAERRVAKRYVALVHGRLAQDQLVVDQPIARDQGPIRLKMRVHRDGKSAVTGIRTLQRFGSAAGFSWIEAAPRSGRTHQIRVHLAHLGHPLVGDKLYNDEGRAFLKKWRAELSAEDIKSLGLPRQALHAYELCFQHPLADQRVRIVAPLPKDLLDFAVSRGGSSPLSVLGSAQGAPAPSSVTAG